LEILVNDIKSVSKENIITFKTEFGIGKGLWIDKKRPELNQKYKVEFDISDELIWGKDIQKSDKKAFSISIEGDEVVIIGILEKALGDSIVDLRFGASLIQLEVEGKNLPKGEYIMIRTDSLEIYNA
jgi:hypothetical protein